MNPHAQILIDQYELQPHPEGGYYREIHRSAMQVHSSAHNEMRAAFTTIYFLLEGQHYSAWHRIAADESWFFHAGCELEIYTLEPAWGNHTNAMNTQTLGIHVGCPQLTIAAGCWFAAKPIDPEGFSFVSCVVGPGFVFKDFELASRASLLANGYQESSAWPQIESLLLA